MCQTKQQDRKLIVCKGAVACVVDSIYDEPQHVFKQRVNMSDAVCICDHYDLCVGWAVRCRHEFA